MNKHEIHKDYRRDWRTPKWLFNELDYRRSVYGWLEPVFDFAADADNALAPNFWTEEDDSLSKSVEDIREALRGLKGPIWLNPPYGRGEMPRWVAFVDKIVEAMQSPGMKITELGVLVPASTDTKWFKEYWMRAQHVWLLTPRIRFSHPEKKSVNPPHGSTIFFFSASPGANAGEPKVSLIKVEKRGWLKRDEKYVTKIVKSLAPDEK